MMRLYTAVLFLAVLVITSCSNNKEEQNRETLLSRKWNFLNNEKTDSAHYFLFSSKSPDEYLFELVEKTNDTIKGTWSLQGNVLSLTRFRTDTVWKNIDSVQLISSSGHSGVHLYSENNEIAILADGKISEPELYSEFTVDSLSSSYLKLRNGIEVRELVYLPRTLASTFSIVSFIRGMGGLLFLVIVGWLLSRNRAAINWKIVITGIVLQLVFAIAVLKVPFVESIFEGISSFFVKIISFTQEGTKFLFSSFGNK